MGRAFAEVVIPFLLPFAGYALFLALGRRYPRLAAPRMGARIAALVAAGLALAVLSLVLFGLFGGRGHGGYVPAHMENGALVPGRLE